MLNSLDERIADEPSAEGELVLGILEAGSKAASVVGADVFVAGILIFSGSLYVLAITGIRWLGAITPIGGVCFIAGWVALAVGALRAGG